MFLCVITRRLQMCRYLLTEKLWNVPPGVRHNRWHDFNVTRAWLRAVLKSRLILNKHTSIWKGVCQADQRSANPAEMIFLCASILATEAWTMRHWKLVCGQTGAAEPRELLFIKLPQPGRVKTGASRCQQNDCKRVCACVCACVCCVFPAAAPLYVVCVFVGGLGPSCCADLNEHGSFVCECVCVYMCVCCS